MNAYRLMTWATSTLVYVGMSFVIAEIIGTLMPNAYGLLTSATATVMLGLEFLNIEWSPTPPPPPRPGDDLIGAIL